MHLSTIGMPKSEFDTPVLCLEIEAVDRNVQRMADHFRDTPVRLRPHSKTHKTPALAWKQLAAGAIGITCAKLGEAEVMAKAGIRDMLIANQVVGRTKIARLVNLAAYSEVMVAVENLDNVREIDAAADRKGVRQRVLIEVDIGMGRCGTQPGEETLALAREIVNLPALRFEGIMGYEGHTVLIPEREERQTKTETGLKQLVATADLLRQNDIPVKIVSSGGTGTYDITGHFPGITELQVGSYITMDATYQSRIGLPFEYALTVLATVVSTRGDSHAVINAGLKTMTRDFGLPLVLNPPGWQLVGLSEEHGSMKRTDGPPLKIGDQVEVVPNHGCTTINLHDHYHVVRNGCLEAVWPIAARGKIT